MARPKGHETPEGRLWFDRLKRAQRKVEEAERQRDELVREALSRGLGVRAAAKALGINMATVSRRYSQREREGR
jgi:hypothetical protein